MVDLRYKSAEFLKAYWLGHADGKKSNRKWSARSTANIPEVQLEVLNHVFNTYVRPEAGSVLWAHDFRDVCNVYRAQQGYMKITRDLARAFLQSKGFTPVTTSQGARFDNLTLLRLLAHMDQKP